MKACARCGEVKNEYLFHQDRTRRDGLFPWCVECKESRLVRTPAPSANDRFWKRVIHGEPHECWLWLGAQNDRGYPVRVRSPLTRVFRPAYRVAYELSVGVVSEGLEIDHLCRNRLCCNPHHMQTVTHRVNSLRGNSVAAINARKTHCPQGHEYSPENTIRYARYNTVNRLCRTCQREHSRARKARVRARRVA